jgi:hypothetical protein
LVSPEGEVQSGDKWAPEEDGPTVKNLSLPVIPCDFSGEHVRLAERRQTRDANVETV